MLVRHLLIGVVAGMLAALATGLMGFSVGATVGIYVLGANLGLGLSALAALVPWRRGAARADVAGEPGLLRGANLPLAE